MSSNRPPFDNTANFSYDIARWPQKEWYPLGVDNIAAMTATSAFTLSAGTEITSFSQSFGGGTRFTVDNFPTVVSNATNLTLLNEGDSTDFTRLHQIYTPVDAVVERMTFCLATGLNVSAYTSGNFRLTSIKITITPFYSGGVGQVYAQPAYGTSAPSNMTAVDNQICIFKVTIPGPFKIYSGGILEVKFDVNTALGVGTYQKGVLDIFPYNNFGDVKTYGQSGFWVYYRTNPWPGGTTMRITENAQDIGAG